METETIHEQDWDRMMTELQEELSKRNRLSTPKKYIRNRYGKGHLKKLMMTGDTKTIHALMTEYATWNNKHHTYDNNVLTSKNDISEYLRCLSGESTKTRKMILKTLRKKDMIDQKQFNKLIEYYKELHHTFKIIDDYYERL